MVLVVSQNDHAKVVDALKQAGEERVFTVGKIVKHGKSVY